MDTINERVVYLRKEILHLNQTDFASHLGLRQTSVSSFEQPGASVSNPTIKAICLAFNVNENWLRCGEGDIFNQTETFDLDAFVREHGGTDLEIKILKAYFELDEETRKRILKHFRERLTAGDCEM